MKIGRVHPVVARDRDSSGHDTCNRTAPAGVDRSGPLARRMYEQDRNAIGSSHGDHRSAMNR
jgi:hypothetical protein